MELDFGLANKDLFRLEEEQKKVKAKVDKADALVRNLSGESHRWTKQSADFKDNMNALVGDTLQAAALLTYIGFFDHQQRHGLTE